MDSMKVYILFEDTYILTVHATRAAAQRAMQILCEAPVDHHHVYYVAEFEVFA